MTWLTIIFALWRTFSLGHKARRCCFRPLKAGGSGASGSRGPSSNRRHQIMQVSRWSMVIGSKAQNHDPLNSEFYSFFREWKNNTGITITIYKDLQRVSGSSAWDVSNINRGQDQRNHRLFSVPNHPIMVETKAMLQGITEVGARSWRFRSSLCKGPQFGGKGGKGGKG